MTNVLITGGAGFIGSHLVDKFLTKSSDYEVTIYDDFSGGKHNLKYLNPLKVKIIQGDITSNDQLQVASRDAELIIHLAAMNRAPRSIENPMLSNAINITGTLNVLEIARKNDCRLIFASSSSVFGSLDIQPRPVETSNFLPTHPYGLGKVTSEHYCRLYRELYSLDNAIIRYFAVYGPRQSPSITYAAVIPIFINSILKNKPIIIHGGSQTRNFTYVKDTVNATYLIATARKLTNQTYQIGGTDEVSINELVTQLFKITNKQVEIRKEDYREGDIMRSVPLMTNLKNEFDFLPRYDLQTGLTLTYNWMKENPNYFNS